MILEDLAAPLLECREVGVDGIELTDFRIDSVSGNRISIEIERLEIPVRIAEDDVFVVAVGNAERLGQVGPAELATDGQSWKDLTPLRVPRRRAPASMRRLAVP